MDLLGDGLQLVGFLWVSIIVLSVLVAVAIALALFLNVTGRRILIIKEGSVGLERRLP
jgi:hypothetical protein